MVTAQILHDQGRTFISKFKDKFKSNEFKRVARFWNSAGFIPITVIRELDLDVDQMHVILKNGGLVPQIFEIENETIEIMGIAFGINEAETKNTVKIMADYFRKLHDSAS